MRTSYNIGGTTTGRWSSSQNAFGRGTNFQNLREDLRQIFIADPGKKFAYIDLETAESRVVGARGWQVTRAKGPGRDAYWRACEAGDLHTQVAKIVWPNFDWTGDKAKDRQVADRLFYRHHSYRQACKMGGHGTNYIGKPPTLSKHTKIPEAMMAAFQSAYFRGFPEINEWHLWVIRRLMRKASINTLLGRKRVFFGRLDDEATWREGAAFEPQSVVGDILNLGAWRIWNYLWPKVELMAQIHDAVLVQYDEADEAEWLPKAMQLMEIPIAVDERILIIPTEASVGWNWNKRNPDHPDLNPDGLMKWSGVDGRARLDHSGISLLDKLVHKVLPGLTHSRDLQDLGSTSHAVGRR
jgi:DNA polymerase I-like protein with 3'-5' exonuclease and polymerase domains